MRLISAFFVLIMFSAFTALAFDEPDLVFYFPFEEFDGNTALDIKVPPIVKTKIHGF